MNIAYPHQTVSASTWSINILNSFNLDVQNTFLQQGICKALSKALSIRENVALLVYSFVIMKSLTSGSSEPYIYIRTLLWNSRTWQEFRVIHMLLCFRNNGTVMQNKKYVGLSKNVCRQVCGKWAIVKRKNTWVCQSRSKVRRKQSCEARLCVTLRVYPPCGMLLFLSYQLLIWDQKNIYWGHTAKESWLVYP